MLNSSIKTPDTTVPVASMEKDDTQTNVSQRMENIRINSMGTNVIGVSYPNNSSLKQNKRNVHGSKNGGKRVPKERYLASKLIPTEMTKGYSPEQPTSGECYESKSNSNSIKNRRRREVTTRESTETQRYRGEYPDINKSKNNRRYPSNSPNETYRYQKASRNSGESKTRYNSFRDLPVISEMNQPSSLHESSRKKEPLTDMYHNILSKTANMKKHFTISSHVVEKPTRDNNLEEVGAWGWFVDPGELFFAGYSYA